MRRLAFAATLLAAPLLAACASSEPAGPVAAESARGAEMRAVVQSVDMTTRQVLLRLEDGTVDNFVAGPEVRNLAQLEPGDTVVFLVEEIITARLAQPGDPEQTVGASVGERAALGERPGMAVASGLASVVTFGSFDAATGAATFSLPSGETLTRVIAPDLRDFAAARKPGDRIYVEVLDLVAVVVEEVAR